MTSEEAIKQLKKCKSFHNGSYGEAFEMAIKALEDKGYEQGYEDGVDAGYTRGYTEAMSDIYERNEEEG